MRIAKPLTHRLMVKVQPGKISRLGFIANTHVDVIRAVVECSRQRQEGARRADQFHFIGAPLSCVGPALPRGGCCDFCGGLVLAPQSGIYFCMHHGVILMIAVRQIKVDRE